MKDMFSRKGWIVLIAGAASVGVFAAWAQLESMYPSHAVFVGWGSVVALAYVQIWARVEYFRNEEEEGA